MSRTWFITGASTGFGRELTIAALGAGNRVVATARKPETLSDVAAKYGDNVLTLRLDVTKKDEIDAAVRAATDRFGAIDVLVNNAGYAKMGAFEEITDEEFRSQFETNVFGVIAMTQAVLPRMRARRSGHILNISSVSGLYAMPGLAAYSSSKFAVEGFTESLAAEVAPLGVRVILVEPGGFNTSIADKSPQANNTIADYALTAGATVAWAENATATKTMPGDSVKGAQAMLAIVDDPNPALRLLLGSDALAMAAQKIDSLKADWGRYAHISRSTDAAPAG